MLLAVPEEERKRKKTLPKYVDANNVEHMKAMQIFFETGGFPREFVEGVPKDMEFTQFWFVQLLEKLAKKWVQYKLSEIKPESTEPADAAPPPTVAKDDSGPSVKKRVRKRKPKTKEDTKSEKTQK